MESLPEWNWLADNLLEVDGERFRTGPLLGGEEEFIVLKEPWVVRAYRRLLERMKPRRIVEIGMRDGGSTALLALAARPDALVGVDLTETVPPKLANLIERRDLGQRVHAFAGVDQADRRALLAAVSSIGDQPLDLVIDDASHMLPQTIASFETLFPLLRPGGTFLVEDWNSDYVQTDQVSRSIPADDPNRVERATLVRGMFSILNSPGGSLPKEVVAALTEVHAGRTPTERSGMDGFAEALVAAAAVIDIEVLRLVEPPRQRPLCDIAVALTMSVAASQDIVRSIRFDNNWIQVERGEGSVDPEHFKLAEVGADHFGYLDMGVHP